MKQPIGVFDSGVGGLSVWKEIAALLPNEDIIYYADNANCPYGPKSQKEVVDLSDAIAIPGLYSFNDTLDDVSGDDFVISYSGSKITIRKSGEISIETSNKIAIGNQTSELLDILSRLLGELSTSLTTAEATPIQGTVLYNTLKSEIDNLKGSIWSI